MSRAASAVEARMLEAATPVLPILRAMDAHRERMIAIQMEAYPDHWTEDERREMAELHLFGAPASQDGLSSLRYRAPSGLDASRFNPSRGEVA